jgi:hypothetical protein
MRLSGKKKRCNLGRGQRKRPCSTSLELPVLAFEVELRKGWRKIP